jgi:alpha-L-rhamnosidase
MNHPTPGYASGLLPIPDRLIVLTFDDGHKSDITNAAPLLSEYGFGATFFISEGLGVHDPTMDGQFLDWDDIRTLHNQGFEIGNHTKRHLDLTRLSEDQIRDEIRFIQRRCEEHQIPTPTTFCYPGFLHSPKVVDVVAELGFAFARRGVSPEYHDVNRGFNGCGARGPVYDPREDHPLLIPTTGYAGPEWTLNDLVWAVDQARDEKIASICFHGVPCRNYPWVSTENEVFVGYMRYLRDAGCTVISMGELSRYVNPEWVRGDPYESIDRRCRFSAVDARCEYRIDPLGLDQPTPNFSWKIQAKERSQSQSAYRVLVSSSRENLDAEIGDRWDSQKVSSGSTSGIAYAGNQLRSGEKCWWKVLTWDGANISGTDSFPATFEMGLLDVEDWKASWICADPSVSAPLLRKQLTLSASVVRARAYVSGLGYYELYVNGDRVGDQVLDPATTYYHNDQPFELGSRVLYATHDVTRHLRKGSNAIGILLGNGWYSAEDDVPPSPSHREPYGEQPIALLQLEVELETGEFVRFVTDTTWKTSAGPIRYNDYSHGETYDAQLELPGWSEPGFNDASWADARSVSPPSGALRAQTMLPIRVVRTIAPVGVTNPESGVTTFDFGQNMTGWTRLQVTGPQGSKITIRHGHGVYGDGRLDDRSNMYAFPDDPELSLEGYADGSVGFEHGGEGFHHGARQIDEYILSGNGSEVWEPRFTLHGFRYAEIIHGPEILVESAEARHVRSSVPVAGSFDCSEPLVNRIHDNITWTFASSLQGFPQDAADRSERVGWLGDPVADDFAFTFDSAMFWSKWLDDLADSQTEAGDLPVISPLHWRRTWDPYLMYPVWKSSYFVVAWDLYLEYGDSSILERHYGRLEALASFLGEQAIGHLIEEGLGDHMEPQSNGVSAFAPTQTPVGLTSTAFYYRDVWILARAAEILGYGVKAEQYSALADEIRTAFNKQYFDQATANYATGSQASNAIPLAFGLVPSGQEELVVEHIVSDILINHGGHLSTGMLGTDALARVLPRFGHSEVLYGIVTQTTFPSWGEQILKGATTLWEAWEGETDSDQHGFVNAQLSYNMKLFGSIQKFLFRDLAGIRRDNPGYETFSIEPQVVGGLEYAAASVNTVRGLVSSSWHKDDSFRLNVGIPPNTRATVRVPTDEIFHPLVTEGETIIWEHDRFVSGHPGVTGGSRNEGSLVFAVGSGNYSFTTTEIAKG